MIKSLTIFQKVSHKSVGEELSEILMYLQYVKKYKIINIFEVDDNRDKIDKSISNKTFVVIYDTFTEYISDDDLMDDHLLEVNVDEITKKKVNKWCYDHNAIILSFGKYAFKYFDNDIAKIKIIGYDTIPEDILDSKEESKEPIERKKTKGFKIDKETIDLLCKIKDYCEHKDHCWKCPLGYEAKDSSGERLFRCKLAKGDPRYWDLEKE